MPDHAVQHTAPALCVLALARTFGARLFERPSHRQPRHAGWFEGSAGVVPLRRQLASVWLGLAAMPLPGSRTTEPTAIAAPVLAPPIFRTDVRERLKDLAQGVLFVNVSGDGTLTWKDVQ